MLVLDYIDTHPPSPRFGIAPRRSAPSSTASIPPSSLSMSSPNGPPNNRLSIPGCSTATYKQNAFEIVHAQVERFREIYNGGILVTLK